LDIPFRHVLRTARANNFRSISRRPKSTDSFSGSWLVWNRVTSSPEVITPPTNIVLVICCYRRILHVVSGHC
jgi:hypothetical protein